MKIAVKPEPQQIQELLKGPADQPVVMVNLLRFKKAADDGDRTGEAAYREYGAAIRKLVEGAGGRFIWAGRVDSQVLGESDVDFDVVGIVEYPSRKAFIEISSSPEFRAIEGNRTAGLEGQWLLASSTTEL